MKKLLLSLLSIVTITFTTLSAHAETVPFPADWAKYTQMKTTLSGVSALPSCEADVALLPLIYQKVVETYCTLKQNGPGKVDVLVSPAGKASYEARDGKMPDGPNMILHFRDMKLLLVTAHQGGKPHYAVYTDDGRNVTTPSGPLSVEACETCHTGYQSFCKNGQCGSKR